MLYFFCTTNWPLQFIHKKEINSPKMGLDLSLKVHKEVNNIGPAPVFVNTVV